MKRIIVVLILMASSISYGFNSPYADSLFKVAANLPPRQAVQLMLDNAYFVYSKSYEDGIQWTQAALDYSIQLNDEKLIANSKLRQGTVWYLSGDYEKCIDAYLDALTRFEAIDDLSGVGRTCNELSVYYRKQKQYEIGLEQLDRSYRLCSEVNDMKCVETSLNNRGVIYEMMGKYDLAKKFYRKAEKVAKQIDNQVGLSYIYNNLAECHRLEGNYDSVLYFVNESSAIRIRLDDQQGVAMNYTNLGEMFTLAGKYDEAEIYLDQAIAISEKIKYPDLQRQILQLYFELFKKQGEFEKAAEYLDKSMALKDSLLDVEKIKSLSEMEVRFETEKIEKEYAKEQQLRAESDLKLANRNNWIIGICGAILILIFLALFLHQRKMKIAQEEKNAAVLDEKNRGLQAVFDATEEERQRIAKDLHDGVGQQMSGLKLAWENLSFELKQRNEEGTEKLSELSEILNETAQEVREISHQMMPKVLGEFGLVPAIKETLEKSLKYSTIQYEFEQFNIEGRFSKRVELSLYRIVQELLNNVIKHSGASYLSVQLFKNKEHLILIVEDNGAGFDQNNSNGHGLLNIKSRLNTISGEVNYEASSGAGTIATVRVNLTNNA